MTEKPAALAVVPMSDPLGVTEVYTNEAPGAPTGSIQYRKHPAHSGVDQ